MDSQKGKGMGKQLRNKSGVYVSNKSRKEEVESRLGDAKV